MTPTQEITFHERILVAARQQHKPVRLGNWFEHGYGAQDYEQLTTNILTMRREDLTYQKKVNMIEAHRLENYKWCPKFLIDVLVAAIKLPSMSKSSTVVFTAEEAGVGYTWHSDSFDIIITNLIGESTWYFEDGTQFEMKPYDVAFVPLGLFHRVIGKGPRVTASIGHNRPNNEQLRRYNALTVAFAAKKRAQLASR